jgi:hypothetical protein
VQAFLLRNGAKGLEIDKEGLNTMLPGVQQRLRRYLCIAPGLIFLIALFAGCGTYTYGQGGQSQTTPAPTATSSQRVQNCGTVGIALNGQPADRNQARLAGNCFWQAFQHCQAATLLLKEHSLDTGADHTFTIKSNNGKCSVVDTVKHYIVPNNQTTTTTYSCSGLVMQADGLHFIACGNLGSIHLPL